MPNQLTVDQYGEIMRALGRLEQGQTSTLGLLANQTARLNDHGKRLGNLEGQRSWLLGAAAAIAALVQFLPLPKL